jgi:RNA polymerase sigma factor (TIGR02999 family)
VIEPVAPAAMSLDQSDDATAQLIAAASLRMSAEEPGHTREREDRVGDDVALVAESRDVAPAAADAAHEVGPVTELLIQASGGNTDALNRLFPIVYDELRQLARSHLRRERSDHTLTPTALVHEAYMKLVDQTRVQWQNRHHFYGVASQAMRRILVNHAQTRKARKRGGAISHVAIDESHLASPDDPLNDVVALDAALERLKSFSPRGAEVVVYRFFGGLTNDEIADLLDLSEATVRRAWRTAKTWLRHELRTGSVDRRVQADATD